MTSSPKKRSCLTSVLTIVILLIVARIGIEVLAGILDFYSHLFGEAARNRQWVNNNMEFAAISTQACRTLEAKMIASEYKYEADSPIWELQPLELASIRFADVGNHNLSDDRLRFYPVNAYPVKPKDFDVVLSWYRKFKYKGNNPPFMFDPDTDIKVSCFVSRSRAREAVITWRLVGQ